MLDEQLKQWPKCQRCGGPQAMVYVGTNLVCGNCAVKMVKKYHERMDKMFLEE